MMTVTFRLIKFGLVDVHREENHYKAKKGVAVNQISALIPSGLVVITPTSHSFVPGSSLPSPDFLGEGRRDWPIC